ncbi:hypothetical protein VTL71DRAFT_13202 [Oculimacula yallundae]|uniref:Uncharacterized protein n=1 Tax=Oculimacula yallundae TaxID=86028 RepID=A0ABR4CL00_9HELO
MWCSFITSAEGGTALPPQRSTTILGYTEWHVSYTLSIHRKEDTDKAEAAICSKGTFLCVFPVPNRAIPYAWQELSHKSYPKVAVLYTGDEKSAEGGRPIPDCNKTACDECIYVDYLSNLAKNKTLPQ